MIIIMQSYYDIICRHRHGRQTPLVTQIQKRRQLYVCVFVYLTRINKSMRKQSASVTRVPKRGKVCIFVHVWQEWTWHTSLRPCRIFQCLVGETGKMSYIQFIHRCLPFIWRCTCRVLPCQICQLLVRGRVLNTIHM